MEEALKNLLLAREARAEKQKRLIEEYIIPLVVIHANCPGIQKTTAQTKLLVEKMSGIFEDEWHEAVRHKEYFESAEGPVSVYSVEASPQKLKAFTVETEEHHPLGRFADMDVYTVQNHQISRKEMGISPRRCYLCQKDAKVCARSGTHPQSQLTAYMNESIGNYFKESHQL